LKFKTPYMSLYLLKIYVLGALSTIGNIVLAQKNIIISDSLTANSEKLNVKMGTQSFGKIWRFRFGEYKVVSSKLGWTTTSAKSNLLNTKTESKSTEKFSFILTNKTNDSANVNASNNIDIKVLKDLEIISGVFWGNKESWEENRNFSAFIAINQDTSETWTLLMNTVAGGNTQDKYSVVLTNGERKIFVIAATSNKNGDDSRSFPAQGYEFVENGLSLCAVQYYGGGALGMNKNIVWILNSLNEKMKLVLAAAATALLQIKVTSMTS